MYFRLQRFQLPDVFQGIQRISGPSADALGKHHVDLSRLTVSDHTHKILSRLCPCAGFLVGINAYQLPAGIPADQICEVCLLSFKGRFLILMVCGHTTVGRYPDPVSFFFRRWRMCPLHR